jgi:type III secretory pathway component EscV
LLYARSKLLLAMNLKKQIIKYKKPIIIITALIVLQLIYGFDPKFCFINLIWLLF